MVKEHIGRLAADSGKYDLGVNEAYRFRSKGVRSFVFDRDNTKVAKIKMTLGEFDTADKAFEQAKEVIKLYFNPIPENYLNIQRDLVSGNTIEASVLPTSEISDYVTGEIAVEITYQQAGVRPPQPQNLVVKTNLNGFEGISLVLSKGQNNMAVKYTLTKSVTENLGDLLVSAGYPRADLDKVTFGAVAAIDEEVDGSHVNTSIKVTVKKALADKIELAGLTVEESGEDKVITHKFNRLDFLKEIGVTESTPAIRNEVYGEVMKTDELLGSYLHEEHLEKDNFNVEIKETNIDYQDKLVAVLTPKDEFTKVAVPSKLYMARKLVFTHPDHKVVHKVKFLTDVLGSLTNTVETTFEGVDGEYDLSGINPTELSNIPDSLAWLLQLHV